MEFIRVGALAEIPEGEVRPYDVPVGRVAVAHMEHRLFAFGDECTHQGCSLSEGDFDDRAGTLECPCHGSVFDVETGEPIEGPAQDALPVFQVQEVDGWVEVSSAPAVNPDS
jgi:3-phenylpropionate/trans-cinnamate dioxygenase ferredoxin subunit